MTGDGGGPSTSARIGCRLLSRDWNVGTEAVGRFKSQRGKNERVELYRLSSELGAEDLALGIRNLDSKSEFAT